jgi:hypothetical protein
MAASFEAKPDWVWIDVAAIQQWLLRYGKASMKLQKVSAEFITWIANELQPSCAAYQAFQSGHIVALDKSPGVCPVGIGEGWMCYDLKYVLFMARGKARDDHGVEGIEDGPP